MIEKIFIPVGWLLVSPFLILLMHAITARLNKKWSPQLICVNTLIFSYIPMGFLFFQSLLNESSLSLTELLSGGIYFFIVYSCITYIYFSIFHLNDARRIKILQEIYRSDTISLEKLLSLYSPEHIFEFRVQRLIKSNQVSYTNNIFKIEKNFLYYFALIVLTWRLLLGFESPHLPFTRSRH